MKKFYIIKVSNYDVLLQQDKKAIQSVATASTPTEYRAITLSDVNYYIIQAEETLAIQTKLKEVSSFKMDQIQGIINSGEYVEEINDQLTDVTGRQIVRLAATQKGWHYQAHSIQFEVCGVNSIYNKDHSGNDLGFSTIKVYRADGTECVTQVDANLEGVKTIVQWKPTFDFEIISGNVRQATKEDFNTYMYVIAKMQTGYPAPYDILDVCFTQGGVNMKYIGADETLKTDGRASKLVKGSEGNFFEVIANHDAGNKHEMSVIFEIYKDPTT